MSNHRQFWQKLGWGITATLAIVVGTPPPSSQAAESIYLQAGPFQTKVEVEDLEEFSRTGEVPPSLGFYSFVLTPTARTLLNQSIDLEQPLIKEFVVSFLGTTEGKNLLDQFSAMFPDLNAEELAIALKLTITEADQLNLISLLKAYPGQSITVDLATGVTMLLQFNASQLQSQLLIPTLEAEFGKDNQFDQDRAIDPSEPGYQVITTETLFLQDEQRDRSVTVDLYHGGQENKPLVMMSHGFASDRRFLKYLAIHLASHGYTVAAIEHKGSNINEYLTADGLTINPSQLLDPQEFITRPEDISFVIDELTRQQGRNRSLNQAFDPNQVVMVGHSFGGYTALALAGAQLEVGQVKTFCDRFELVNRSPADWLQCEAAKLPEANYDFKDDRVKQLVLLNPIVGQLFQESSLAEVTLPTLMLTSTEDRVTPLVDHQLLPFNRLGSRDRFLVAAMGATHMSVTDQINQASLAGQNPLFKEIIGEEANPLRNLLKGMALAFISTYGEEQTPYPQFLSNGYAQTFNHTAIEFGLTPELSDRFNQWLKLASRQNPPTVNKQNSNLPSLEEFSWLMPLIIPGNRQPFNFFQWR